jgi:hypothetical protein
MVTPPFEDTISIISEQNSHVDALYCSHENSDIQSTSIGLEKNQPRDAHLKDGIYDEEFPDAMS